MKNNLKSYSREKTRKKEYESYNNRLSKKTSHGHVSHVDLFMCFIDHLLPCCIRKIFCNGIIEATCSMFIAFNMLASVITYVFS